MFLLRWENFTSTSFLGFRERCQYLQKREEGKDVVTYSPTQGGQPRPAETTIQPGFLNDQVDRLAHQLTTW